MTTWCPHDDDPLSCPPCQGAGGPRTLPRWRTRRRMAARYPGRCAGCGEPYAKGESIAWQVEEGSGVNRYLHSGCV